MKNCRAALIDELKRHDLIEQQLRAEPESKNGCFVSLNLQQKVAEEIKIDKAFVETGWYLRAPG